MTKRLLRAFTLAALLGGTTASFAANDYQSLQTELLEASSTLVQETLQTNLSPTQLPLHGRGVTLGSFTPNWEAFLTQAHFQINLPGLSNLYAVRETLRPNRIAGTTWTGDVVRLVGTTGNVETVGRALFVINDGKITGNIHTGTKIIAIRPAGGAHVATELSAADFPADHGDVVIPEGSGSAQTAATVSGDVPVIDVLVPYTPAAAAAVADIQALIELAVQETNDSWANSGINAQLRLVGTSQVDYTESDSASTDVSRLREKNDGYLDEVHALRDQLGADVVMLISEVADYCGMASVIYANADQAFAIADPSCATGYYTFGHELGHLMGARHNPEVDSNSYPFEHGHGYYYEAASWRTVMSYNCPNGCTRLPYWSNPNKFRDGQPMGTAQTHDNTRVLNQTAAAVAAFRSAGGPVCHDYTATNSEHVSANRAYTETSGSWWYKTTTYYAVGSGEKLGTAGTTTTTLKEDSPGHYSIGECPASAAHKPEITAIDISINGDTVTVSGNAKDDDGDLEYVEVQLPGSSEWVRAQGTASWSHTSSGWSAGDYEILARGVDSLGQFGSTVGISFRIDPPATQACVTTDNRSHISAGRAYQCGSTWSPQACATGSGANLGYASTYYNQTSSVQETSSGYWTKVTSCQ